MRAGAALPPGGARLLFSAIVSRTPHPAASVAVVVAVAVFPLLPLPQWRLIMDVHISGRPSSQLNPRPETAAPRRPCRLDRKFALVLTGSGTGWDNGG